MTKDEEALHSKLFEAREQLAEMAQVVKGSQIILGGVADYLLGLRGPDDPVLALVRGAVGDLGEVLGKVTT